jgi:hypothetical protein
MGVIALSHLNKAIPNARLSKAPRLVIRFAAAKDHMNSLELVATTCGIVVLVLLADLAGTTCRGDVFWNFSEESKCTYSATARISRKEMMEKVKTGEMVNVEELAKKEGGQRLNESLIV